MSALSLIVVGANGRVGRLLIPAFRALGAAVGLTQRDSRALTPDMAEVTWAPLDGPAPLAAFIAARGGPPKAMLVLAGSTPGTGADMAVNIAVAQACTAAARAVGIGRILLASSSAIYGHGRATPWRETEAVAPASAYGHAKLEMERRCAGPDVCALRIGNVAGADALLTNPRRPLVLDQFPDGNGPIRSYIGPQSLARVLVTLAETPLTLPPVLNIGAPLPVDMADLARAAGIPFDWHPAPPGATARLTLDLGHLETLVTFQDRDSTAAAMIAQWRHCQTQPEPPS
ncbi:NAD(P)-dependent oxidoreductase [Pararhodobacter sp.]|uniref:NAD-dependent epimerase/dehydratase family protein n=1 Tax=Pararhodobacter sp. TaxID=2127056 RepID=UPI002AFF0033|nr:NAD(P)-dependent oxidoreductase [Pararhodobacter sp.]